MKEAWRSLTIGVDVVLAAMALATPSAQAQGLSASRSLGGYGAGSNDSTASIGANGSIIPYSGNFGGFLPYRMGGGSNLSFSSRGTSTMASGRTSFSLSPITGAMSSMQAAPGQGLGARPGGALPSGARGSMGLGRKMRESVPATGSMSVMPPNFGYPFYQPPRILAPSAAGMSM
jgi:hypothetical protein